MDLISWVIIGIIVIIAIILIGMYNGLVGLFHRIKNARAQIDVQTKRRYDLVPNLVETVKGYAKHEKDVFTDVTKARTAVMSAGTDMKKQMQANNMLAGALKTLFAVAENYPQLRASENFMQLQEELSGIESKIAYARQFYNDSVLTFNARINQIPWSMLAGMLHYAEQPYYEVPVGETGPVKVKF